MLLQALTPKDARVLVVEDSPNDQEIVKRALKTFGTRHTEVAKTAEEGLYEAKKHNYDIATATRCPATARAIQYPATGSPSSRSSLLHPQRPPRRSDKWHAGDRRDGSAPSLSTTTCRV